MSCTSLHRILRSRLFVDASNVGAVGHSLGGYTVIGMAGGWRLWKTPELKAVIALSPFVEPFIAAGTLSRLDVPVTYQTAWLEWDKRRREVESLPTDVSAEVLRRTQGRRATRLRVDESPVPRPSKCCRVFEAPAERSAIDRYAIAFLDRYLKGKPEAQLDFDGKDLNQYMRSP
jgi:hypothetical protein